ncbi:TetR/AcrR family transcriptional regulator [Sinomonas sp. ASV322]|uniref:TetR/AcrR family transcriptional regulator n=1 Tax=Sinomonas sp. ASV322 TaxID=3041920 RepID=UPI0027DEAA6A|nr:TetR/AcrR family transcriptional regulator [Sinomonas sp. ASV322]MDQ4504243.1 TetR/AcrR family transcriptional regulator [Sinomonas sp. ASV322]
MARETTSLRERQRARTQNDILEAVIEVIASSASDGPVIEQIAGEAGVSRATLYAHFPGGMDELVTKAYERAALRFIERVHERQAEAGSWRERIVAHGRAMVDIAEKGPLGRFYNISAAHYTSVAAVSGIGSRASHDDFVVELAAAADRGELADVDIEETAHLLTGAVRIIGVRAAESPKLGLASLHAFERLIEGLREAAPNPGTGSPEAR